MPITPFRQRIKNLGPGWLQDGTGERLMYVFGAMVDARMEKVMQGTAAHLPTRAQPDALPFIGADRLIAQGLTESPASYAVRLQTAFDAWRLAGTSRAVLSQILGYLLAMTPKVEFVATRYALDPARLPSALALYLGVGIADATNATPIKITTTTGHGLVTGDNVTITGVRGNTAANGAWAAVVVDPMSFTLFASTGNGAYAGGGRAIKTSDIPATSYPPTRMSSKWDVYPVGRSLKIEPVTTYVNAGGAGDWDWDSLSPITGSWGWWSGYVVLFAVAPNAFCQPAQAWGTGSVYTPSADGYYSTVDSTTWILAGSYTGSSQAWGAGSIYTPAADGYYSTVNATQWIGSGIYNGVSQAWGVDQTTDFGQSIARIVAQFKSANTWVRSIIVSFSSALFDVTQGADGVHNPAGTFGQWSTTNSTAWTDARFTNAAYGGEVT